MSFNPNKFKIEYRFIKKGDARSGQKMPRVGFLVAHDVGVPNSRPDDNFLYFNNHQPLASAHAFIDDVKILVIVPLNEKAWHVRYDVPLDNIRFGDDANDIAIGAELCYGSKIDFKKAYERYVWFLAYCAHQSKLNPVTDIIGHEVLDPARRSDPTNALRTGGKTFGDLIRDIVEELEGEKVTVIPSEDKTFPNQIIIKDDPDVRKNGLYTYSSADWEDKKGAPKVKVGDVFTVKRKLKVDGFDMYQLISGWYITAADKYVGEYKAPKPVKKPSYVGKTVKAAKPGYQVNFYSRATWDKKYKVGEATYDLGFRIMKKVKVDGHDMYHVYNSNNDEFYITASSEWVRLV